jgi:hypothetical protein
VRTLEKPPLISRLSKMVPTDMDWHPSYPGGYCQVALSSRDLLFYTVSVSGGDDTDVCKYFDSFDAALALYNSLRYIQSSIDLVAFTVGSNNNGWPSERRALPDPNAYRPYERTLQAYRQARSNSD